MQINEYLRTMNVLIFSLVISVSVLVVTGQCPIDESGYTTWSSKFSGLSSDDNVTVSEAVVLDVAELEVFSIHIEVGGELLFSDTLDISVRVHYILVDGDLIIGTEACKHQKNVLITLVGEQDEYKIPSLDEKVVGVRKDGTLELHGKDKLPWAKLTKTVYKFDYSHGLIYKHLDEPDPKRRNRLYGLSAHVFDSTTGASVNHIAVRLMINHCTSQDRTNENIEAFKTFLDGVTNGQVVALAIQRFIIQDNLTELYSVIEDLTGSTEITKVPKYGAWTAIAIKGDSSKTVEEWTFDADKSTQKAVAEMVFLDNKRKIKTTSYVDSEKIWNSYADFASSDSDFSLPILELNKNAGSWEIGDTLVLTSTDYDWKQAEECQVIQCDTCAPNQVRINCEPEFTHFGEFCTDLDRLDMRGEVGLLTRNIKIQGETDNKFGGHIKMLKGHKNAHIEGVELFQMGQNPAIGRYPIHFHMCLDVGPDTYAKPAYIRSNSIHHTFARATTIHGTHNCTIEYNFIYDTHGHACFLEDGGEQDNVFQWNLVGGQRRTDLIPADSRPASYWVTNPKNYYRNNIAFGGDGNGFWFVYPQKPVANSENASMMELHEARHTAIYEFSHNTAHSNAKAGLFVDNEMTEDFNAKGYNRYKPFNDPFNPASGAKEVIMEHYTGYKNKLQNAWIRGGRVTLDHCSLSDSFRGVTTVRENSQHPIVQNCIIIGDSCNLGKPMKGHPRSLPSSNAKTPRFGYVFNKGPNYLYNTYFGGFKRTADYRAGALAVEFREGGKLTTVHTVEGLLFGFDDSETEGARVTIKGDVPTVEDNYVGTFRDTDGSVTNMNDSQVVQLRDFYLTDNCKKRSGWGFAACPNHYGYIIIDNNEQDMKIARDDDPTLVDQAVDQSTNPIFMVILGGEYSYITEFQSDVPNEFRIMGFGITRSEWLRIGVCIPKNATIELRGFNMPVALRRHNMWNEVTNVTSVDDDTDGASYYFDRDIGVLFLKLIHTSDRTSTDMNNCPGSRCPSIRVTVKDADFSDNKCIDAAYANGKYTRSVQVENVSDYSDTIPKSANKPPSTWGADPAEPNPW